MTRTHAATHEQALKFAECMRDNGVKEFPDPDASGQLTIDAIGRARAPRRRDRVRSRLSA